MENKQAKKVLSAALATGADLAELYVQNKLSRVIERRRIAARAVRRQGRADNKLSRVVQLNYKRVDNVATTLVYGAELRLPRRYISCKHHRGYRLALRGGA